MSDALLSIGMFVFGLPDPIYNEMSRRASWRWAEGDRYGARAASQYLGPGDDTISVSGVLVPEIAGSYGDIERLREMAGTGEVWPVVLGTGLVLGDYRIDGLDDTWRHIMLGGLARAIDFTVELKRVDP